MRTPKRKMENQYGLLIPALLDKGDPEFAVAADSGAYFERPLHICNSISSGGSPT